MSARQLEIACAILNKFEGFYWCNRCDDGCWKKVCNAQQCRSCNQWVHPNQETAFTNTVVAQYACNCTTTWSFTWLFEKKCDFCRARVDPISDLACAVGTALAYCEQCQEISYELNGKLGDQVRCRTCKQKNPSFVVCSQEKLTQCEIIARHPLRPQEYLPFDKVQGTIVVSRQKQRDANVTHADSKACVPFLPEEEEE